MTEVKVGQIWIDNDKRGYGRRIRIVEIGTFPWDSSKRAALCEHVITGHQTWIRLNRFKPTSTGYRLEKS
jgi:hypothetical protein